jgi:hypothetical protein
LFCFALSKVVLLFVVVVVVVARTLLLEFDGRFYDSGAKTTWYHKCKLEQCAPFAHPQGLVARLSLFEDTKRTMVTVRGLSFQIICSGSSLVPRAASPNRSCCCSSLLPLLAP